MMTPDPPTFQQYSEALERLRRRAHMRRAVMTRGVTNSIEMPAFDDQEITDRRLCQLWQDEHGFGADGF